MFFLQLKRYRFSLWMDHIFSEISNYKFEKETGALRLKVLVVVRINSKVKSAFDCSGEKFRITNYKSNGILLPQKALVIEQEIKNPEVTRVDKKAPVVKQEIRNPKVTRIDNNRINASKLRTVPCQLVILPGLQENVLCLFYFLDILVKISWIFLFNESVISS